MFLLWITRTGKIFIIAAVIILCINETRAQERSSLPDSFRLYGDVRVTVDNPEALKKGRQTVVIFYALPNGNSTEWTMGKKMQPGDDWHYDIQHTRAQTAFIRQTDRRKNYVVIYLENDLKSWPAWKKKHSDYRVLIPRMVDSLSKIYGTKKLSVHLNGHSGGGSFIFGYLDGVQGIEWDIDRITFLDSNYGYENEYFPMFVKWLQRKKPAYLNVFAYNDSVALYNGKPFVSATGGTWYRSHMMLAGLQTQMSFEKTETDSLVIYKSPRKNIQFFFKKNPDRGIYHTQQVELNGFIHSVFMGTRFENKGYSYYGSRAYEKWID